MPELPEVETIARRLQQVLPGKKILGVSPLAAKSFIGDPKQLVGATIIRVDRRAKVLSLVLNNGWYVATHLKMTGQLIYIDPSRRVGGGHPTADWTRQLPSSHTRIHYTLSDGADLFFNDQRLFGWMKVLSEFEHATLFAHHGPDITEDQVTVEYLQPLFARRTLPIKQVIMDNQIVAGIGNIYACDCLNLARIAPNRAAKTLTRKEIETLLAAAKQVINRAIELGGTTSDGMYVNIDGFAGGYQEEVLTYGRMGQPCYNCGSNIIKTKLGGRGTYWCPVCQV
jgi:formamidopyrimidine-DNA glycosylase